MSRLTAPAKLKAETMRPQRKFLLKLKGKTAVFVDWANVYGWNKSLKKEVNPRKLYKHFKRYKEIRAINFYFGTDQNIKSKQFLKNVRKIGYRVITKPVKYVVVGRVDKTIIRKRKCDFDLEIGLDCFEGIDKYESFIFLSGDGDFATLYARLIRKGKQVIVVYAPKHIGKEIWEIKRGIFKINIENMGL